MIYVPATESGATALLRAWQQANGFPERVRDVLDESEALLAAQLLLAFVEPRPPLRDRDDAVAGDLQVLAKLQDRSLAAIAVASDVVAPFDATVAEWLAPAPSQRMERLEHVTRLLELDLPRALPLRHQLLQRAARALSEARRFNAAHALLLLHSFGDAAAARDDYAALLAALDGGSAHKDSIVTLVARAGVALHLAWVHEEESRSV